MRISDWSSDVCSSDLSATMNVDRGSEMFGDHRGAFDMPARPPGAPWRIPAHFAICRLPENKIRLVALVARLVDAGMIPRSEEHTSELQSLMRISYAVFCLKKKKTKT